MHNPICSTFARSLVEIRIFGLGNVRLPIALCIQFHRPDRPGDFQSGRPWMSLRRAGVLGVGNSAIIHQ